MGEVTGTPAVEQGIGQGAGPGIGRFRVSSPSRNFVIDYEGLGRVYLPPDVPRETQKPSVYATPFPAVPLPPVPTRTSAQIINQAIARANEAAMQEAERASERAKEQARKSALIRAIVLAVAVADDD